MKNLPNILSSAALAVSLLALTVASYSDNERVVVREVVKPVEVIQQDFYDEGTTVVSRSQPVVQQPATVVVHENNNDGLVTGMLVGAMLADSGGSGGNTIVNNTTVVNKTVSNKQPTNKKVTNKVVKKPVKKKPVKKQFKKKPVKKQFKSSFKKTKKRK